MKHDPLQNIKNKGVVAISYGIIRIEKYHRDDILGIESHDKRKSQLGNSNKDINWSLTHKNYDVHFSDSNITFTKKINERIKELKLSKAPRKDAVVMAQVLITSDYKFFENISQDEQEKFFEDSYDFICKQYGKENIISAILHLDEATPHMYINFVPVTSDGRLSAKDLFDRRTKALNKLQTDFFEEVAKGYGLERGEEGSKKKHLASADYKLKIDEIINCAEAISKILKIRIRDKKQLRKNLKRKIPVTTIFYNKDFVLWVDRFFIAYSINGYLDVWYIYIAKEYVQSETKEINTILRHKISFPWYVQLSNMIEQIREAIQKMSITDADSYIFHNNINELLKIKNSTL